MSTCFSAKGVRYTTAAAGNVVVQRASVRAAPHRARPGPRRRFSTRGRWTMHLSATRCSAQRIDLLCCASRRAAPECTNCETATIAADRTANQTLELKTAVSRYRDGPWQLWQSLSWNQNWSFTMTCQIWDKACRTHLRSYRVSISFRERRAFSNCYFRLIVRET